MSSLNDDDRILLRSIQRRNIVTTLTYAIPFLVLVWLLTRLLERRFHVAGVLSSQIATVIMFGFSLVIGKLFKLDGRRDPRETPRLRWVQKEKFNRLMSRQRVLWSVLVGFGVFLNGMSLVLGRVSPQQDGGSQIITYFLSSVSVMSVWQLPPASDEAERAHHLVATHRAYLVTIVLCAGAVFLGNYWPGRLAGLVSLALMGGVLTQQVSLILLERGTGTHDD